MLTEDELNIQLENCKIGGAPTRSDELELNFQSVQVHLSQAKLLLERHRRVTLSGMKTRCMSRIIDGLSCLCRAVEGLRFDEPGAQP
jgi:hypothetical protein